MSELQCTYLRFFLIQKLIKKKKICIGVRSVQYHMWKLVFPIIGYISTNLIYCSENININQCVGILERKASTGQGCFACLYRVKPSCSVD